MNYEASMSGVKKRVLLKLDRDMFGESRMVMWTIIKNTQNVMWLIVTEQIENMAKHLPKDWNEDYSNCCIMAFCEKNADVERAMTHIPDGKQKLFGLYIENMSEQINLSSVDIASKLSVVIVGNEYKADSKPNHPDWVEKISADCLDKIPMFYEGCGKYSIHKVIDNGVTVPPVTTQIREKVSEMMVWTRDKWHDTLPSERIKVRKLLVSGSILAVMSDVPDFSGVIQGTVRQELPAAMM
ncbi:MAG: DUF5131 family protein [Methylophilus sp.]|uniref:DUF5131 family protein n=1 Tax=Methylophilus sp. TaxID=29541 RepID=UPI003FA0B946